ncbi:MAG TPA: DUF2393 family protein [Sulfuricurvum sp.]|nr:DUF2393 family protein [Sulfuricurvum sp.]
MKTKILDFIHTLSLYDYLLFGGILFFFLLFIILALLLHHRLKIAIALIVMAFLLITIAPFSGYLLLHKTLYNHTLTLTTVQDLQFSDALLLRGDLSNTSNQTFNECTITFGVSKTSSMKLLTKMYPYTPFQTQRLILKGPIKPNETRNFKLLIEPFNYPKKFSVTARGICT